MMPRFRFLIAFVAVVFLCGAASKLPSQYSTDQRIAKITWKAACRISNYEVCPKRGPAVRRSPVIDEVNAWGAFWPRTEVIWIGQALELQIGTRLWLTIFHEQIHYLQGINTIEYDGYDKALSCLIEREALDFTNAYAEELGRSDMQRTVERWRELYNCDLSPKQRIMH
jgi:hypothetical protein